MRDTTCFVWLLLGCLAVAGGLFAWTTLVDSNLAYIVMFLLTAVTCGIMALIGVIVVIGSCCGCPFHACGSSGGTRDSESSESMHQNAHPANRTGENLQAASAFGQSASAGQAHNRKQPLQSRSSRDPPARTNGSYATSHEPRSTWQAESRPSRDLPARTPGTNGSYVTSPEPRSSSWQESRQSRQIHGPVAQRLHHSSGPSGFSRSQRRVVGASSEPHRRYPGKSPSRGRPLSNRNSTSNDGNRNVRYQRRPTTEIRPAGPTRPQPRRQNENLPPSEPEGWNVSETVSGMASGAWNWISSGTTQKAAPRDNRNANSDY